MPIISLYTTVLLPTCPLSDCILLVCYLNSHYQTVYYWSATNRPITMKGARRRGRQKKRWEDNIKKWTGMGFGAYLRAAEDREGWKGIVATSSVVPRRPPRLRDWDKMRDTTVLLPTGPLPDCILLFCCHMPITRLNTTVLLPTGPLPYCILLFCYQHAHYQTVNYCSATHMPITRLYTPVLLPTGPLPDCILLFWYQ